MQYSPSSYLSLPDVPGVYLYRNKNGQVIYVGKANNLKSRVSSYFTSPGGLGEKTRLLVADVDKIEIVQVESELEALLLEAFYIKKHRPYYNIRLTDDKSYPLIKITPKDRYPAVLYARRMDDPKALYFGPYPSPQDVRRVLRVLRRIFPYQSVINHPKKICLYYHLGLCPCLPANDAIENRKEYLKNLKKIVAILEGRSKAVQNDLEKERKDYTDEENFEKAGVIQHQIEALELITKPHHSPFEYDVNPNLREDLRENELSGLKEALESEGLQLGALKRIECYDISNIQGTDATGSMVVLSLGEIDKSQYRKFKIKISGKPNDFAMMEEMLTRRLKHAEWGRPDLIIIDGGKGQLTSVLSAMKNTGITYPVVGLAKREETLIIPVTQKFYLAGTRKTPKNNRPLRYGPNEENFIEVSLPKNSPSLHLVQRIRDEAHRFAVTFHKKLRSKAALAK